MNEWGYSTDAPLPALVDAADFRLLTSNKLSADDASVEAVVASVSAAVRSWCGWHVAPSLQCTWTGQAHGRLVALPCMCVTEVSSVSVHGRELAEGEYEWSPNGLLRLRQAADDAWQGVTVVYTAGASAADGVAAVVAQMAANSLVATPGVREEHAGQVGASYNQTGNGVSGGVSILDRDMALLSPWRLTRI